MNAKISHYDLSIGRGDDAGRGRLWPADSSKHSGGNHTSGSCSPNSESCHNGESSGEEDRNGGEKRGGACAYHAKTKVQLRTGHGHRFGSWGQPEKAVSGSGPESCIPGIEGLHVWC